MHAKKKKVDVNHVINFQFWSIYARSSQQSPCERLVGYSLRTAEAHMAGQSDSEVQRRISTFEMVMVPEPNSPLSALWSVGQYIAPLTWLRVCNLSFRNDENTETERIYTPMDVDNSPDEVVPQDLDMQRLRYQRTWESLRVSRTGTSTTTFLDFPWPVFHGLDRLEIDTPQVNRFIHGRTDVSGSDPRAIATIARKHLMFFHPDKLTVTLEGVVEEDRQLVRKTAEVVCRILTRQLAVS
ncbi:hypothetical protein C8R46DRAFT_1283835 [Mycena filopes]|nr:hypothetical protein C8R46DRAFT_1283835 [Mycena filopes]